jgi:hypothetical protein
MKRRLVHLATAASLVLALAVAALWVVGHAVVVRLPVGVQGRTQWCILAERGSLTFMRVRWDDPALGGKPGPIWQHGRWGFYSAGSYWCDPNGPKYGSTRFITVPCWALVSAVAVPTALRVRGAVRRERARRLRRRGRCPVCGYDLRATPGRCPECGQPADPAHPLAAPHA